MILDFLTRAKTIAKQELKSFSLVEMGSLTDVRLIEHTPILM